MKLLYTLTCSAAILFLSVTFCNAQDDNTEQLSGSEFNEVAKKQIKYQEENTVDVIIKNKETIDEGLQVLKRNDANPKGILQSIESILLSSNNIKNRDKNYDLSGVIETLQSQVSDLRDTHSLTVLQDKEIPYLMQYFKVLQRCSYYFPFQFNDLKIVDYEYILDEIIDRTKILSGNNNDDLVNVAVEARKWKLILNFYNGLNEKEIKSDLEDFNNYITAVKGMGFESTDIHNHVWDAKAIEIELIYSLGYYQQCISLTDQYFSSILENLTPDTLESQATITALEAQGRKIRSLSTIIKKGWIKPNELEKKKSEAIQMAEELLSFEDTHSYDDANKDIWKERILILSDMYIDFGDKNLALKLLSDIYNFDPIRFSDFKSFSQ